MEINEIKKDLFKSKAMAQFSHYVSGNLYYRVELADGIYQFPIATVEPANIFKENVSSYDIKLMSSMLNLFVDRFGDVLNHLLGLSEDLGTTPFPAEIRGSELSRWIIKAVAKAEFIKVG